MSDTVLVGELGLTARDIGVKQPETPSSFQKLAQANGRFYNSILDVYLSADPEEAKQKRLSETVTLLPEHARGLYEKGLQAFQTELGYNHTLLEQHRGEEVKYLVRGTMETEGGHEQSEIEEVLSQIKPEHEEFIEPTKGIPIILAEEELYGHLVKGVTGALSVACFKRGNSREEPSYIVVKAHGFNDNGSKSYTENLTFRHELHHFVWHLLERSKFVREVQESSPELTEAFGQFRHEFAAYLIEDNKLGNVDVAVGMTKTSDKDINKLAGDINAITNVCIKIAASRGIDAQSFLYPVMASRNFAELRQNILKLASVDKQVAPADVATLFGLWNEGYASRHNVEQFLREANATISADTIREMALKRLASLPYVSILQNQAGEFAEFNSAIGNDQLDKNDLLAQALREKLPFPDDVIQDIVGMPSEVTAGIPVVNDVKEIIHSLLSHGLDHYVRDYEKIREAYVMLINATPEARLAFDRLKGEVIAEDERRIRESYQYTSDQREQLMIKAKKKAEFLRSL